MQKETAIMVSFVLEQRPHECAFFSFVFSLHMVIMCGLESRIKLLLTSESAAIYHLEGSLDRVSLRDQFSQFPPVILAGARGGGSTHVSCVTLTRVTGSLPHCVLNSCSVHLYISQESRQHLIMTQVSSTENMSMTKNSMSFFGICCL